MKSVSILIYRDGDQKYIHIDVPNGSYGEAVDSAIKQIEWQSTDEYIIEITVR